MTDFSKIETYLDPINKGKINLPPHTHYLFMNHLGWCTAPRIQEAMLAVVSVVGPGNFKIFTCSSEASVTEQGNFQIRADQAPPAFLGEVDIEENEALAISGAMAILHDKSKPLYDITKN